MKNYPSILWSITPRSLRFFNIALLWGIYLSSGCIEGQQVKTTQMNFDSIAALSGTFYSDPFKFWHDPIRYGVDPDLLKSALTNNSNLQGWDLYYCRKALIAYLAKERDSALHYVERSIEAYNELENPGDINMDNQMLAYYIKGKGEVFQRAYHKSTNSMQRALEIAKSRRLTNWIGPTLYGIARNHFNLGNDSIALQKFIETSKDSLHMNNSRAYVATYSLIASLQNKLKDYKQSKANAMKAIFVSDTSDFKTNLFPLYGLVADVFKKEQNIDSMNIFYKKAIDRYEKVEALSETELPDWNHRYTIYKSYFELLDGNYNKAVHDLRNVIAAFNVVEKPHINDKDLILLALEYLGEAYERQDNAEMYSEIIKTTITYLDRFNDVRMHEQLEKLEIEYQTREKDLFIKQLEKNEQQQLAIISQQRIINFGLFGLIILLIVVAVLYLRQKKLKSLYETQALEQRLLRAQMNPHFTFNTLSVIQNMIDTQPKDAKLYLVKFSRLLVSIFESSTKMYVSLEEELDSLKQYLELQKLRNTEQFHYTIDTFDIDINMVQIPGMLLQPIVENSIVHGLSGIDYEGEISIRLKFQDKYIYCEIEDNGSGLEIKSNLDRNTSSTMLISSFLEKVTNKKLSIHNKAGGLNGSGLITKFHIPFKSPDDV